jgi:hypothetical protein
MMGDLAGGTVARKFERRLRWKRADLAILI